MQKISLEEFQRLKSEFDEIYDLIIDESQDKSDMFFSDGSLYSEEEAENRLNDINERLLNYDLSDISAEDFGRMIIFATSFFKGLKDTGANIDFSLFDEEIGFFELGDVRGCTLINPDFSKMSFSDKVVAEKTREEYKEYFLDRPDDIVDPKNEAIDRYYAREMTIDDVILLREELSDGNKTLYISDRYKQIIDKVGFDRLAELWSRESIYMESFILDRYDFLKYLDAVTEEMTAENIINTWFAITRKEIEDAGIHRLTRSKSIPLGADIIDIDVSLYGENFINQNPEFFVEDRSLPDEIKQKFYNGKLSFDEFFQYREEFEGIMVGIGIEDKSGLRWQLGRKKFSELIDIDAEAMFFLQDAEQYDKYMVKAFLETENYEIESFKGAIEDLLRTYKVAIFNNDIDIKSVYENKFFRDRLPELFLDEEAPDELKEFFYGRNLKIDDLNINPEWIQWIEGKKEYVKRCCIRKDIYDDWKTDFQMGEYSSEVEEYMLYMYEEELRVDRKKGNYLSSRILEGEFKTNNPDLFFEDLPKDLQKLFEERNIDMQAIFDLPREQKELLKNKELSMLLISYGSEFAFCHKVGGSYEDFEIYEKYRTVISEIISEIQDGKIKNIDEYIDRGDIEELLKQALLQSITTKKRGYSENAPEEFKTEHPELFISQEDIDSLNMSEFDIDEIKDIFYKQAITFNDLREYPQLRQLLKEKNLTACIHQDCLYLLELYDGDIEEFFEIGMKYGNALMNSAVRDKFKGKKDFLKIGDDGEDREWIIEDLLIECIKEKSLKHERESLPQEFKRKNQEFFLLPEELASLRESMEESKVQELISMFNEGKVKFQTLKEHPQFKDIIIEKNFKSCMIGLENEVILKLEEVFNGDRHKAVNVAIRFSTQIDALIGNESINTRHNVEKIIEYYKEMKFIPHPVVVRKFPADRVKDFALNSKLWGKLMSMADYTSIDDYKASLLEVAMIMGVFETKEFEKNGQTMIQGIGQNGFDRLHELLNKTYTYDFNPAEEMIEEGKVEFVGKGYVKTIPDYKESLLFYDLQNVAIECDLLDEMVEGGLSAVEVQMLASRLGMSDSERDIYFEETESGSYRCSIDTTFSQKLSVLFETLGIKDSSVLAEDEFKRLRDCDREYILRGFVKTDEGYRFNMAKIDDMFVVDRNTEIDEVESKENKRLFDYIKYLMMEYGLDVEGGLLGANNDRSNIELVLSEEKIEKILTAADEISKKAAERYCCKDLWIAKEDEKKRIFTPDILHTVFDGTKMEYNKVFVDFLLEYGETIVSDPELISRIKLLQETVIEISKDEDLRDKKVTPELVIRMLGERKYDKVKVGFERGVELAQKYGFSQQQFEEAQEIWEEAKKREASSIPRVEKKEEEYSYEVLRLDDAVGIFVGNITECCQKVGGFGETAMLHSMKEKNGRVFVVRNASNKIIAQAWLWRNGNIVCFDNVEVPHKEEGIKKNQDMIYEALKKAARDICEKDAEVIDSLVAEGKIDKEKGDLMKVKKVTVGKGNTNVHAITGNTDRNLEDDENRYSLEAGKEYNGKELYTSDSRKQVIVFKAEDYVSGATVPTLAIHKDENVEKNLSELSYAEIKTIKNIEMELDPEAREDLEHIKNSAGLAEMYGIESEVLKIVKGTDWFMLYSENDEAIKIYKMLKSPSSGIVKKSVREQKEAVKMIMDKAAEQNKTIRMEIENDRVYEAAKVMIKHTKKDYEMDVVEEDGYKGHRIEISGVEGR